MKDPGVDDLRTRVQGFVRSMGLLADNETPCGRAVSTRDAQALHLLREWEEEGREARHGDLQQALGIDKSNVTRLVQRLDASALVVQVVCESDGRSRVLALTPQGRRLAAQLDTSSRALFKRLLQRIPEGRRAGVIDALKLLEEAAHEVR